MPLDPKERQPSEAQAPKKRPYSAPKLVELGKVKDLTAGAKGSGGDLVRKAKT